MREFWRGVLGGVIVTVLGGIILSLNPADILDRMFPRLPENAVVIVDDPGGCPGDWSLINGVSEGTSIVAAGDGDDTYGYRDTGGEEAHALTLNEMPSHSHGSGDLSMNDAIVAFHIPPNSGPIPGGSGGAIMDSKLGREYKQPHGHLISGNTDTSGNGEPHNNMPPYIALYFCKKMGGTG